MTTKPLLSFLFFHQNTIINMDLNGLWQIAKDKYSEKEVREIWDNHKEISLTNHTDFLQLDYTKFGFEFQRGKIHSTGIDFQFRKKNYDLHVSRFYSGYKKEFYDSALLTPHYTQAHFNARKSGQIRQTAKDIKTTKDFVKLQKSIAKRFPFLDDKVEEAKLKFTKGVTFKLFTEKFMTHTIEDIDFEFITKFGSEILLSYGHRKYTIYYNDRFADILN